MMSSLLYQGNSNGPTKTLMRNIRVGTTIKQLGYTSHRSILVSMAEPVSWSHLVSLIGGGQKQLVTYTITLAAGIEKTNSYK